MAHVRRKCLLTAGETLLLCTSPVDTALHLGSFVAESGISAESVLSSTFCKSPLPRWSNDFGAHPDGRPRRRWEGTHAEFMWHPLMWLPARVRGRYQLGDGVNQQSVIESDDLWAIRVALELTASGLYDPATGSWVDILATVGIDVDDELDVARVRDWLDGLPDEVLDDVDLSAYLDVEPPEWGLEMALELHPLLQEASWALLADELLAMAEDNVEHASTASHSDQLLFVRSLAGLAETLLHAAPDADSRWSEPHATFFARMADSVDIAAQSPDALTVIDLLDQARARLHSIREANWASVDALRDADDEPVPA